LEGKAESYQQFPSSAFMIVNIVQTAEPFLSSPERFFYVPARKRTLKKAFNNYSQPF